MRRRLHGSRHSRALTPTDIQATAAAPRCWMPAHAELCAFGKAVQVPSEGMPMHAVSANDLAFRFCGGHPKAPFAMSRMAHLSENPHRTGLAGR